MPDRTVEQVHGEGNPFFKFEVVTDRDGVRKYRIPFRAVGDIEIDLYHVHHCACATQSAYILIDPS
jgi:hypothetical protein